MLDITSQVESLIKKGDTEEKSAAKIKRLNTILKLLCDQRKSDEEEKQKAQAQSMIHTKLVKMEVLQRQKREEVDSKWYVKRKCRIVRR